MEAKKLPTKKDVVEEILDHMSLMLWILATGPCEHSNLMQHLHEDDSWVVLGSDRHEGCDIVPPYVHNGPQ